MLLIHLQDSADIFLDVQIRSTADHLDNDMIFLIKSKLHIIHNIHIIHKSNTQVHWNYNCVYALIEIAWDKYSERFFIQFKWLIYQSKIAKHTCISIYLSISLFLNIYKYRYWYMCIQACVLYLQIWIYLMYLCSSSY